jgi:hypothetical protein
VPVKRATELVWFEDVLQVCLSSEDCQRPILEFLEKGGGLE